MAKKPAPAKKKTPAAPAPKKAVTRTSGVRNSPVPKKATAPKGKVGAAVASVAAPGSTAEVTYDMIARRAYEISQSAACGSDLDNWCRAERELRGV
jgi:hypothetical protein